MDTDAVSGGIQLLLAQGGCTSLRNTVQSFIIPTLQSRDRSKKKARLFLCDLASWRVPEALRVATIAWAAAKIIFSFNVTLPRKCGNCHGAHQRAAEALCLSNVGLVSCACVTE